MRNYEIRLMDGQSILTVGYEQGANALDAFENAIGSGGIFVPPNFMGYVVAINDKGLAFKFEISFAE